MTRLKCYNTIPFVSKDVWNDNRKGVSWRWQICFEITKCLMHTHQFKRNGKYYKFHFDKEAYTKPKTSGSLCSKLEVFIWRHAVYLPKLSTTFRGILICVIFRPRDMQESYMLFGIFAKDVGLYFLSVFYIAWADFQYTNVYLFCVLHTYHCVPLTGEYHGTAANKAQTRSIYDVIGHRLILFLPRVWTRSVWRTSY
jgi:hypothetical protein